MAVAFLQGTHSEKGREIREREKEGEPGKEGKRGATGLAWVAGDEARWRRSGRRGGGQGRAAWPAGLSGAEELGAVLLSLDRDEAQECAGCWAGAAPVAANSGEASCRRADLVVDGWSGFSMWADSKAAGIHGRRSSG